MFNSLMSLVRITGHRMPRFPGFFLAHPFCPSVQAHKFELWKHDDGGGEFLVRSVDATIVQEREDWRNSRRSSPTKTVCCFCILFLLAKRFFFCECWSLNLVFGRFHPVARAGGVTCNKTIIPPEEPRENDQ